jgi:hypothetical protein
LCSPARPPETPKAAAVASACKGGATASPTAAFGAPAASAALESAPAAAAAAAAAAGRSNPPSPSSALASPSAAEPRAPDAAAAVVAASSPVPAHDDERCADGLAANLAASPRGAPPGRSERANSYTPPAELERARLEAMGGAGAGAGGGGCGGRSAVSHLSALSLSGSVSMPVFAASGGGAVPAAAAQPAGGATATEVRYARRGDAVTLCCGAVGHAGGCGGLLR